MPTVQGYLVEQNVRTCWRWWAYCLWVPEVRNTGIQELRDLFTIRMKMLEKLIF